MITLYGFGNIFPAGRGETKDLRAQWALEETGLPYRVHALDHAGGEAEVRKLAGRWLGDVERRLKAREWIACADFTVADTTTSAVSPARPGNVPSPSTPRDSA
jgi:glutathione S-transferase